MARRKRYWLFKSEPGEFSLADLRRSPRGTAGWDGVRNYQARNLLRDEVKKGDGVLFYHSGGSAPAVVGVAEVVREAYPDPTAFDPQAPYFDRKSDPKCPRWFQVDVRYVAEFERPVPLRELRATPALEGMALLRKGNRLSIQPVTATEWRQVTRMGGLKR